MGTEHWINIDNWLSMFNVDSMLIQCWFNISSMLIQCWFKIDQCWFNVDSMLNWIFSPLRMQNLPLLCSFRCSCDAGYEGSTCDRRVDSAAFIIAIIALVLVIIVIIICCICCCVRQRWGDPFHHHVPGPVVEPSYGVYGARPWVTPANFIKFRE